MIQLVTSNAVEALADALADRVASARSSLFEPVDVVVPNALVETFVKQRLARRLGIAAHVRAGRLRAFLRDAARASAPGARIVDRDVIEGELLALFHDPLRSATAALEPVRIYMGGGEADPHGRDRRRTQLAGKLADLFEEYAYSRPAMLAAWRAGQLAPGLDENLQRWQREAWLALFGRGAPLAPPRALTLPDLFADVSADALHVPPLHVFGISYVARLYRTIFAALGRVSTLHVYALNPCREFWEDVDVPRRRGGRREEAPRRKGAAAGASRQLALALDSPPVEPMPAGESAAPSQDNPLLARWGKPGRDNIRLLNQLVDFDFDARFIDPGDARRPTLLAALQREVLDRQPGGRERPGPDDTLTIVPAPDARRELETIAAEIWTMLRRDEARERRGEPGRPLRFSDFAVIVPPGAAARYLPLARSVFHDAADLPHTLVDLPPPGEGRIGEAVELLLALPESNLARPDLLRLAMHPAVARRFPEVDPEDWLALADELPIVSGADAADHADSYLEHDRVSWDQGIRRLALGAFLSGRPSGAEQPFDAGLGPELPAEAAGGAEPAAQALGVLARELLAFARVARGGTAPVGVWLDLIRRTLITLIRPSSPEEEGALGDCFAALERVAEGVPPELTTGFLVAAELVRARLGAREGGRHRAPEGVTVASFVPMRALPFRVIFVAGLDERVFPSSEPLHALDLRAGGPAEEGDVTPRERDEYMFLETVLAARERLVLSYVARDARSGDSKDPSSILLTLRDYLGPELAEAITRPRPPLLRHEDEAACAVISAAARERQAAVLGAALRRAAGAVELPAPGDLGPALAPELRPALGRLFHWPSPPARPTPPSGASTKKGARMRSLTLADLRRFLECPLQASASVLLPLGAEEDLAEDAEAALLAHENLDDVRVETVPLLREVFARSVATGADAEALSEIYDSAAELKRLEGVLPSGIFGRATRERHLGLLAAWRAGLAAGLAGASTLALAPVWLGGGPEHRRGLALRPAVRLAISLPDGPRTVELHGVTELLADHAGERLAVCLIATPRVAYTDALLLRPWLTHLALAAGGGAPEPLRALLIRPDDGGGACVASQVLPAVTVEEAQAYLSSLARELLGGVHDYLLPCEGVFTWRRRLGKPNALPVRDAVLLLRDDNWTRLSSDRGPVSDARSYPVPAEAEAAAIVARRFGPFFAAVAAQPKWSHT